MPGNVPSKRWLGQNGRNAHQATGQTRFIRYEARVVVLLFADYNKSRQCYRSPKTHAFFFGTIGWALRLRMKSKMNFIQMVEPAMAVQVP